MKWGLRIGSGENVDRKGLSNMSMSTVTGLVFRIEVYCDRGRQ